MKYITALSVFILLFTSQIILAQNNTFIGIEGCITYDIYEFTDTENVIQSIPLATGAWGFNIGQEINDYILVESGLVRKYYAEGFGIEISKGDGVFIGFPSNSFKTWQIPVRIKSKINLLNNKLFLIPILGLHFSFKGRYGGPAYGNGGIEGDSVSVLVNYTVNADIRDFFLLQETGLGLEVKIFKATSAFMSLKYFNGFEKVSQISYNYTVDNEQPQNAFAHSNGDYWSFGLGLNYIIRK